MVDLVRRDDDDDDEDTGVDTDGTADRSTVVGDEAIDVVVDEVVIFSVPGAIGPEDKQRPQSQRGSGRS
jgi:hypothetical protein